MRSAFPRLLFVCLLLFPAFGPAAVPKKTCPLLLLALGLGGLFSREPRRSEPSDHYPVRVQIDPAPEFVVPPPPGLTSAQRALWNQVAARSNWGRTQPILRRHPNVLTRAHLFFLGRWHFEQGMTTMLEGRTVDAPGFRHAMEVVGADGGEFLAYMEDLADQE